MEADKDCAVAFAVSANTPGLKIIVDRLLLEEAFEHWPWFWSHRADSNRRHPHYE
jgi:hypothetical protein